MSTGNNHLSNLELLRLKDVLKIIPVGKSTIWSWVKNGKFPKPFKISERTTVWKIEDIKSFRQESLLENKKGGENE